MHLVFVDDARQRPTRRGIRGNLVAAGAISLPADNARSAERAITATCIDFGFPPGEEFKWSPGRESWMHGNLHGDRRTEFFAAIIDHLLHAEALATIVIADDARGPAISALTAEQDVVALLLERIANRLKDLSETGLVVADRPGGEVASAGVVYDVMGVERQIDREPRWL